MQLGSHGRDGCVALTSGQVKGVDRAAKAGLSKNVPENDHVWNGLTVAEWRPVMERRLSPWAAGVVASMLPRSACSALGSGVGAGRQVHKGARPRADVEKTARGPANNGIVAATGSALQHAAGPLGLTKALACARDGGGYLRGAH